MIALAPFGGGGCHALQLLVVARVPLVVMVAFASFVAVVVRPAFLTSEKVLDGASCCVVSVSLVDC